MRAAVAGGHTSPAGQVPNLGAVAAERDHWPQVIAVAAHDDSRLVYLRAAGRRGRADV
jgi:hypothetical protein